MKRIANTKTIAELFMYAALCVIGASIVFNPWIGENSPLYYIASMYLIFAFFAFFAYFLGRKEKEGDYELILLSLVNVVIAVLLFYFRNGNLPLLLSYTLSSWAFFYIALKLIIAYNYKDINKKKYNIKMLMTSVILIFSAITIFKLFNDDIVTSLTVYGYYFIIISALNFLEVLLNRIVFDSNDDNTFKMMPNANPSEDKKDSIKELVEKSIEEEKKVTVKPTVKKSAGRRPTKTSKAAPATNNSKVKSTKGTTVRTNRKTVATTKKKKTTVKEK